MCSLHLHVAGMITSPTIFWFCLHTTMSTSNKEITVAGYKYREYRGYGRVPDALHPLSVPRDISLDISHPYRVFIRHPNEWIEWILMLCTAEVPHPTMNRIVLPTVQRFSWVASSSLKHHTDALMSRLGGRIDCANTHVAIILNGENNSNSIPKPIPLKTLPVTIDHDGDSSSSNLSSMSLSESDPHPVSPRQRSDTVMSVDRPPALSLSDRCAAMRAANAHIYQQTRSSPRMSQNKDYN